MPLCHKCKHQREIERLAGVCKECPHQSEIAKLREICTACSGASDNFGGNVHLEAAENPGTILRYADTNLLAASKERTATLINLADEETVELLKLVVAEFANLTDCEAPVVCRRLRGQPNYLIAHEMRKSPQVIWQRWTALKRKNPLWGAIDNGMIGLRGGGRKPGQSRNPPTGEVPPDEIPPEEAEPRDPGRKPTAARRGRGERRAQA